MATGYHVNHAALTQAQLAITDASETLNTTIANLMNEIESMMPTWQGLGATAFTGYMTQYRADAGNMNQALASLGTAVGNANKGYAAQDDSAKTAWNL